MQGKNKISKFHVGAILTAFLFCLSFFINISAEGTISHNEVQKGSASYQEPTPVSEDCTLREEFVKHFRNNDGSYTATMYSLPVHYKDDVTGEWKDIDNSLVETTDEKGSKVYKNCDGLFDVTFTKTPGIQNSDLVTMKKDEHTISWRLINPEAAFQFAQSKEKVFQTNEQSASPSAKLIQSEQISGSSIDISGASVNTVSSLVYSNLLGNQTDVRFTVTPLKIKEDYLLHAPPVTTLTYTTKLFLSNGLTPSLSEYGDISITDPEDKEIFCIASPYMTDAAGEVSSEIQISFQQTDDGWLYIITPSLSWLQDDTRQYPVTVDPTVYATNNAANTWDTYIYEGSTASGGVTRQILDRMYIGNRNSSERKCRGLIYFLTMPTINGSISSATLTLSTPSGTSTWQNMTLYRITSNWESSTVAWPGPNVSTIQTKSVSNGKYVFDVLSTVQDMYKTTDGQHNNYGFEVRYTNENANDYNSICSSEYGVDTEINSTKPYLAINYTSYSTSPTSGIVSGEYYAIRSKYSGLYIDVTNSGGAGSSVIQFALNGGNNQKWRIVYEGDGWYSFAPSYNLNLRLDVLNGSHQNGQNLYVYGDNGTDAQRWRIISNGDGSYRLMPKCAQNAGCVMDIEGPSTQSNAPLQIWSWDSNANQMKWYLEKASTVSERKDAGYKEDRRVISGTIWESDGSIVAPVLYAIPISYQFYSYYDDYVFTSNDKKFIRDVHLYYLILDRSATYNPYYGYFASMNISRFDLTNGGTTTTYHNDNTWTSDSIMYGSNQTGASRGKVLNITKYGTCSLKGYLILEIAPSPLDYHIINPTFTMI